jgi:hypothetical protein
VWPEKAKSTRPAIFLKKIGEWKIEIIAEFLGMELRICKLGLLVGASANPTSHKFLSSFAALFVRSII